MKKTLKKLIKEIEQNPEVYLEGKLDQGEYSELVDIILIDQKEIPDET